MGAVKRQLADMPPIETPAEPARDDEPTRADLFEAAMRATLAAIPLADPPGMLAAAMAYTVLDTRRLPASTS